MKKYLLILCSVIIVGCSASYRQQRDKKKLDALAIEQQPEFKRLANLLDPCFGNTIIHSDTVIKLGKRDTVQLAGSTIITHVKDTVVKTITLPGKIVTVNKFTTITDTVPDNRALSDIQAQLKVAHDSVTSLKATLKQVQSGKKNWMWTAIGALVGLLVIIIIGVYKFINGGFVKSAAKLI